MYDINDLIDKIELIRKDSLKKIQTSDNIETLKKIYNSVFGKDKELSLLLSEIRNYNIQDKKTLGEFSNKVKKEITDKLFEKETLLKKELVNKELLKTIDVTMPGISNNIGSIHPISQMIDKIVKTFEYFGFSVASGPEIETDWFCFQSLNLDINHPARDMQDTFYIKENHILPRTHTSSVQIRTMLSEKPPIRIIAPGRVYRNENQDQRHTFMFYQFEGLVIDKTTNIKDLKNILTTSLKNIFNNEKIELRLRHSFFPYTEPSFEIDATCLLCNGVGCRVCSNKGWIELMGAGMIHPQVLRNVNIDPQEYQGFAFGGGPERLVMVKNMIDDTRLFYENDLRFLSQFKKI